MQPARIDVLIPVYNGARTLGSALRSMQTQTLRDIRIHVVDDGSTDDTPHILRALADADDRIVVHTQANAGIVDALNAGLAHCTGPYVARHDADDIAYPQRLERQLDHLLAHPECIAVGAAVRHIDAAGVPTGSFGRMGPPDQADAEAVPCREPYLIHPFLLVRRDALAAVGGYRHAHHAEDSDLYWRLRERGALHNLPDVLGDYRLHDESISGRSLHNGRLMSVGSQLAGLSARRRAAGRADLAFDKARVARLRGCDSLQAMVDAAADDFLPGERDGFELAVAAKLVELTGYRPYELEAEDCRFIRRALDRGLGHLPAANRRLLGRQISGTAARLAHRGRWREAAALLPWRLAPQFVARYAFRVGLPVAVRRRVSWMLSSKAPSK